MASMLVSMRARAEVQRLFQSLSLLRPKALKMSLLEGDSVPFSPCDVSNPETQVEVNFVKLICFMLCSLACTSVPAWAQSPKPAEPMKADRVLNLWPDAAPQWQAPAEPERDTSGPDGGKVAGRPVIRLGNVTVPQLHWYQAETDAANADTVILVCPGGGYSILAWDLEGTEIVERFRSLGYTTGVIKYRVPTRQSGEPWLAPVQDIQRAISLVRSELVNSKSEQTRIGLVGFSAGETLRLAWPLRLSAGMSRSTRLMKAPRTRILSA